METGANGIKNKTKKGGFEKKNMVKKICFRCKKEIEEESHYYDFVEWLNGKVIRTDSAHKGCWDDFLNKISDVSKAKGMLEKIEDFLIEKGILSPKEYEIK